MKIGITGATGQLGSLVVNQLKEKGRANELVALVRTPAKAAETLEIAARQVDYNIPETLKDALNGMDYLVLISGSEIGERARQHGNVIAAAKEAGVKWLIYTSVLKADTSTLSLAGEHLATEELLKSSGIPYTILRNGWYTENYFGSIAGSLHAGALIGSAGEGKVSAASRVDYAAAIVAVLSGGDHQNKIYELAGDACFTLSDLAAEVSGQSGKEIVYRNLSESEYTEALKGLGVPEGFAATIAGWDVSTSKNDLYYTEHVLSDLIGRPTTAWTDSVKQALA